MGRTCRAAWWKVSTQLYDLLTKQSAASSFSTPHLLRHPPHLAGGDSGTPGVRNSSPLRSSSRSQKCSPRKLTSPAEARGCDIDYFHVFLCPDKTSFSHCQEVSDFTVSSTQHGGEAVLPRHKETLFPHCSKASARMEADVSPCVSHSSICLVPAASQFSNSGNSQTWKLVPVIMGQGTAPPERNVSSNPQATIASKLLTPSTLLFRHLRRSLLSEQLPGNPEFPAKSKVRLWIFPAIEKSLHNFDITQLS